MTQTAVPGRPVQQQSAITSDWPAGRPRGRGRPGRLHQGDSGPIAPARQRTARPARLDLPLAPQVTHATIRGMHRRPIVSSPKAMIAYLGQRFSVFGCRSTTRSRATPGGQHDRPGRIGRSTGLRRPRGGVIAVPADIDDGGALANHQPGPGTFRRERLAAHGSRDQPEYDPPPARRFAGGPRSRSFRPQPIPDIARRETSAAPAVRYQSSRDLAFSQRIEGGLLTCGYLAHPTAYGSAVDTGDGSRTLSGGTPGSRFFCSDDLMASWIVRLPRSGDHLTGIRMERRNLWLSTRVRDGR